MKPEEKEAQKKEQEYNKMEKLLSMVRTAETNNKKWWDMILVKDRRGKNNVHGPWKGGVSVNSVF